MIKKLFFAVFLLINTNILAQTAILNNFRVENTNKNRVYFDKSGDISGLTTQGFVISGKTITAVNTTQNYFTVSVPFTFWDNNTIRLGMVDGSVTGDGTVNDFTLEYIQNNIPEPSAITYTYYVDNATGNDNDNGSSEALAFKTIQAALNVAKAGSTVWVKAGTYNVSNHTQIMNSGTATSPIKIIGYKNSPGDIDSMYYSFNPTQIAPDLDASEMPLIEGNDLSKYGILGLNVNYIIVRNIQAHGLTRGITLYGGKGYIVDNCVTKDMYGSGSKEGAGISIGSVGSGASAYVSPTYYRVINSISINSGMANIHVLGMQNLVDNCKTYCDLSRGGGGDFGSDYYISIAGSQNIIRNCTLEATNNTVNSSSHGLCARGADDQSGDWGSTTSYNLFEKCYIKTGSKQGLQSRNPKTDYNVWKDIEIAGFGTQANDGNGISSQTGAQHNIYERMYLHDLASAIRFSAGTEGGELAINLHTSNNIIRNSIIKNVNQVVETNNSQNNVHVYFENNKVYNCTISNAANLHRGYEDSSSFLHFSNNDFVNCLFNNVSGENYNSKFPSIRESWGFDHTNFWNLSFTTPNWATNSSTVNPNLDNNLKFTVSTPSSIYDGGTNIPGVLEDFERNERSNGKYSIGAFEDLIPSVGSVGPDVTICNGENTTLVATGGTSYLWNTGETTASIIASPSSTTTYTVTVTNGSESDSHDVIVTVNEPPSVNAGSDVSICSGETVTLSASGEGNFLWSTGETTSSITVSPTNTTTYTVTASNTCTDDATDEVIVNVTPGVNLTLSSNVDICLGENITLTAQSNGNLLWSTGETTSSITVNPTTSTTYSVTSSLGDCSKTDEVLVTVNQPPSVNAGSDVSICSGETVTLSASGEGNFLWSTGETTSSITVSPTNTTTYTVTASNTCTDDATDEVIVNVTPGVNLTLSSNVDICLGENITLTAQSNGNLLWSTGETTSSITVNPTTSTTYSVTSSLGDCSKTDEVLVTVNQPPSVNAGSDVSICSGETVTLSASGDGTFLWSTGETASSITVSPTNTTTYTVTASNSCADDATDQIIVTVNDLPTVSVSNDITIENGSSTVLTASGDGNFLWSTGETTSSITVSPSITTTYSVTLTSQQGCSETNSIEVIVTNNSTTVTADAGPDQDVCLDASVELTASGGDSYLWSTGETTPSITVSPTETTTYTVTVSNGNSIDVDDITVFVDENCSDIANRPMIQEFKVYPNPTNGILHIELSGYSNELNISLFSSTGKIIYSDIISNYSLDKSLKRNVNLKRFGKGVYYARIVNNGEIETKKIIVI